MEKYEQLFPYPKFWGVKIAKHEKRDCFAPFLKTGRMETGDDNRGTARQEPPPAQFFLLYKRRDDRKRARKTAMEGIMHSLLYIRTPAHAQRVYRGITWETLGQPKKNIKNPLCLMQNVSCETLMM